MKRLCFIILLVALASNAVAKWEGEPRASGPADPDRIDTVYDRWGNQTARVNERGEIIDNWGNRQGFIKDGYVYDNYGNRMMQIKRTK